MYANSQVSRDMISQVPPVALALRFTVEIFRVLSGDNRKLTVSTLIDYVNNAELFPLTISQLMDVFEMYESHNLEYAKKDLK